MSGADRSRARHRANRHRHSLDRLRERISPDASAFDLDRLWRAARAAYESGDHSGHHPNSDGVLVCLTDPVFGRVDVVYTPRHRAIATVLPRLP